MQSPPGPPKLLTLLSIEMIDLLAIVVLVASAGWAWAETVRRLREAEVNLSSRPRFAGASLIAFSAVALVAAVVSRLSLQGGSPTWWTQILLLLPALGMILVAVLVRMGRASRWLDFLFEREGRATDKRIAAERRATLAESVREQLNGPIYALEGTARHVRRKDWLATEAAAALMTIDAEVDRLKEIQQLALAWSPDEPMLEPSSVEAVCAELVSRAQKIDRRHTDVRFFGIEDLYLDLPRRHVDTMLWGAFEAALAAADEHEPLVEVLFDRRGGHLQIEFESNGRTVATPTAGAIDGIDAARLIVALHQGVLAPEAPPYGAKLRIRLPSEIVVRSPRNGTRPTPQEHSRHANVTGPIGVRS